MIECNIITLNNKHHAHSPQKHRKNTLLLYSKKVHDTCDTPRCFARNFTDHSQDITSPELPNFAESRDKDASLTWRLQATGCDIDDKHDDFPTKKSVMFSPR